MKVLGNIVFVQAFMYPQTHARRRAGGESSKYCTEWKRYETEQWVETAI